MTAATDGELVLLTRRGDNAAFDELWRRHERQVAALCRRYVSGRRSDPAVDARDLTADTFIRALHDLDRYEDRSSAGAEFSDWLLQVARHVCLNNLARQRRRERWLADPAALEWSELPASPGSGCARIVEEREVLRLAAQAINALPELYRTPFRLYLEDWPHREIAARLGLQPAAVMKRVERARRMLRPRLAHLLEGREHAAAGSEPAQRGRRRISAPAMRAVEEALSALVGEHRIVTVSLASGGELQLCLRVDRHLASRQGEIAEREAALAAHPRAWKQRLELADLCYHCGMWDAAVREYWLVLKAKPDCVAAALRLGWMLHQAHQYAEAAEVLRRAEARKPAEAACLSAALLAAEGRDEEAVGSYREALRLAPGEKWCYYGLHQALARLSRYEEQLENLTRLRALDPRDLFGYQEAYTPCARLRRFDIALPLLEQAVALDPNDPMAVKHLFQVRMNLRQFDEGTLALAERLVELAPEFAESWGELSWIYEALGRSEESIAVLQEFLEIHPENATAEAALSWRYHYLRDAERAFVHGRQSYELAPEDWHGCWTYLMALKFRGDEETFERAVAEIAARFPSDAFMLGMVAMTCDVRGQSEKALGYARRAVSASRDAPDSNSLLLGLLIRCRRWEEAVEFSETLLTRGADDSQRGVVLLAHARALGELGDRRAVERLAEAVRLARDPHAVVGLVDACLWWNLPEEALAIWREGGERVRLPPHHRAWLEEEAARRGVRVPA